MNLRLSQRIVLDTLEHFGPMTDEEILCRLPVKMSPSGARTRRRELVDKGLVQDSGRRSTTQSGRKTIIWEAT